jgi:hypothetical protein
MFTTMQLRACCRHVMQVNRVTTYAMDDWVRGSLRNSLHRIQRASDHQTYSSVTTGGKQP